MPHLVLLGVCFALCLASVPLFGGRLTGLADVRFTGAALLVAALGTQVLIISVAPDGESVLRPAAHLASYAGVAVFVWRNRAVPGLAMAGAGALLNLLAIAANGGVMPASPQAMAVAGLDAPAGTFENSAAVADARLAFLGDVFALPASWPVSNVFSFGDIVLVAGVLCGLHRICQSRAGVPLPALLVPEPRPLALERR